MPLKRNPGTKPAARRTVAKKPPVKKPPAPKKAPPTPGLLGKQLTANLKTAPLGTSKGAVVMETLHSVPIAQLKAAVDQAPPKERNHLFSALPGEQIKSIVASLSLAELAPTRTVTTAPPPSPMGGPPANILMTTYENVAYPPAARDPNWSQKISNGNTVGLTTPPPGEWVSVYDPKFEKEGSLNNPMVGLTGWVVNPQLSNGDVWFVHPFGFDFEFYVAPDPHYESLLANTNTGRDGAGKVIDKDYAAATGSAQSIGLPAKKGVLGVETDQDLVPPAFRQRVKPGARIATFGRWIVDCGHPDFHTEIHPPLLMAVATPEPPSLGMPRASQVTHVELMSRPYTVSQQWSDGNFVQHLLVEVGKVETTFLGIPLSTRVEAHPTIFTTPYDGRPFVKLLVKPPVPRSHPELNRQQLMVAFHFTHRTGVAMQVFDAGNDTVGLILVLGDLNPAKLPRRHDLTVQWSQLGDKYSYVIDALQITDLLLGKFASAYILNEGILTDRYDAPVASSPLDNQNVASPVALDRLQQGVGFSEDDNQPFPVYGWMKVWWQEATQVIHPAAG